MAGKRFDRTDKVQNQRLEDLTKSFETLGPGNVKMMLAMMAPKSLIWKLPFLNEMKSYFQNLYSWFEDEYNEHEKTFDSNSLRDFIDA